MKKWKVFVLALVFALTLAGCKHTSDAPGATTVPTRPPTAPTQTVPTTPAKQVIQAGEDQVLAAWTGDSFDEGKRIEAINTYQKNYKNIVLSAADKNSAISFSVDFKVASCTVPFTCAVTGNGAEDELKKSYYIAIETQVEGSKITVSVDFWQKDFTVQSNDILSYCINIKDTEGLSHFYYFRVDYSVFEKMQGAVSSIAAVKEDGFILNVKGIGYVYAKSTSNVGTSKSVLFQYYASDLKQAKGTFTDASGKAQEYTYILENVVILNCFDE